MREPDADAFGTFEHGDRRCRACDQSGDRSRRLALRRVGALISVL